MRSYQRPEITEAEYFDDTDQPVLYGQRWGLGEAPDGAYEVERNLERFQPLHTVAEAIVEYLHAMYEVEKEEFDAVPTLYEPGAPADHELLRCVRLTPRDPSAAPLIFTWYNYPSVAVHGGLFMEAILPDCGCEACDISGEAAMDGLEEIAFSVVAGGLDEHVGLGREPMVSDDLNLIGGGSVSNQNLAPTVNQESLAAARTYLDRLPADGWQPWTPRA